MRPTHISILFCFWFFISITNRHYSFEFAAKWHVLVLVFASIVLFILPTAVSRRESMKIARVLFVHSRETSSLSYYSLRVSLAYLFYASLLLSIRAYF